MQIKFRTAASADMRRVLRETKARWGEAQAAKYTAELRDDINSLRELPLRFAEFEGREGLRRMNSGRHAVFYLVREDRIEIVRSVTRGERFGANGCEFGIVSPEL